MKIRVRNVVGLSLLVLLVVIGISIAVTTKKMNTEAGKIIIGGVNLTGISDGTYTGDCSIDFLYAKVAVVVRNQRIEKIEILEHNKGLGGKAEGLVDDVLKTQSLSVDIVSGATMSSKAILKAIENALRLTSLCAYL